MTTTDYSTTLGGALTLILLTGATTSAWASGSVTLGATQKAAGMTKDAAMGVERASAAAGDDDLARVANAVGTGAAAAEATATGILIATGSEATIMHTLAVAGGPVTMAAGTGLSAAKVMNETLYSNCENEAACGAAQYGTYTGAVAGTAGSAVTVVVVGAGPAGLAAIGSVVGGGMVAGVATLVAAPVVAAAVVGGAVYWLFSD